MRGDGDSNPQAETAGPRIGLGADARREAIEVAGMWSSELRFGRSGANEGQQVGIDRFGVGRRHAVRKAGIGLQCSVLHELC